MRKKVQFVLALIMVMTLLSACGEPANCKAEGCDDEIYMDGYCQYHYTMQQLDGLGKELFDGLFGK